MRKFITFISIVFILNSCNPVSEKDIDEFESIPLTADTIAERWLREHEKVPPKPEIILEKELAYDKHTLEDTYPYKDTTRSFQFDKIKEKLEHIEEIRAQQDAQWGILKNKRGINGVPPLPKIHSKDAYRVESDQYGVERPQAIPLYLKDSLDIPQRYAHDGSLVRITDRTEDDFLIVKTTAFEGEYYIPEKYVCLIEDSLQFNHVIIIDRENQNISTYEKVDSIWKIRSMNPCTTGAHHPPYQKETPLGLFVLQNKVKKMYFYVDGTTNIGGFAPWANRFCQGAYIHGVPTNKPQTKIIEYSSTLGTIPRSHMCVRNASSHAEYIFDNFPVDRTLVYVIE